MDNNENKKQENDIDKNQVSNKSKNDDKNGDIKKLDKDQYIAKLNDDLVEQKKRADEYFDHLKRNMADFDNFKKRINKEKDNMYYTVTSDIVISILPIIDDFEKAVSSQCSDKAFKDGIVMIYNRLEEVLKKLGIKEIKAEGETFNPDYHEAVMHIDDSKYNEKEIVEVLRKGYKMGEKVIRHAMVKVAN